MKTTGSKPSTAGGKGGSKYMTSGKLLTIMDRRGKIYKGYEIPSKKQFKGRTLQIRTIGGSTHVGIIVDVCDPKLKGIKRS